MDISEGRRLMKYIEYEIVNEKMLSESGYYFDICKAAGVSISIIHVLIIQRKTLSPI